MLHSNLLEKFQYLFNPHNKHILDLACGNGRNGLYLHNEGFPVQFLDKNSTLLHDLQTQNNIQPQDCFHMDLETGEQVLTANQYQAILVFRYLHRPLIKQIKEAIEPGGIIVYETFTIKNRQFGRPFRDDFLLQEHELKDMFSDWDCLHYFEGVEMSPDRAIAQIICQKPNIN